MPYVYVGLDGEMSGSEIQLGHRLVQIGVSAGFDPGDQFCSLIGCEPEDWIAQDKAMAVHGIPADAILAAPPASTVDQRLTGFLDDLLAQHGLAGELRRVVPVGINVGAFDIPFVQAFLPGASERLARRYVDLNTLCMTIEGRSHEGSRPKWSGWKRIALQAADAECARRGIDVHRHDAGYDAVQALAAFRWFRQLLDAEPTRLPSRATGPDR